MVMTYIDNMKKDSNYTKCKVSSFGTLRRNKISVITITRGRRGRERILTMVYGIH